MIIILSFRSVFGIVKETTDAKAVVKEDLFVTAVNTTMASITVAKKETMPHGEGMGFLESCRTLKTSLISRRNTSKSCWHVMADISKSRTDYTNTIKFGYVAEHTAESRI